MTLRVAPTYKSKNYDNMVLETGRNLCKANESLEGYSMMNLFGDIFTMAFGKETEKRQEHFDAFVYYS